MSRWMESRTGKIVTFVVVAMLVLAVVALGLKDQQAFGGKYANTAYDQMIAQAARMPAGQARFKKLMDAEELMITKDQAVMPIYFYTTNNMIDTDKWGGWYPNIMDWHPTKYIYLR